MTKVRIKRAEDSLPTDRNIAITTPQGSILWLREDQLDELKKAIEEFQNPTFEKGDIVALSGADWEGYDIQGTLQYVTSKNAFFDPINREEYEIYRNATEDYSARLVGKAI